MAMIHLEIDGREVEVPEGASVLEAARSAGADIPTLCHIEGLEPYGGCRLCLVEIEGFRNGLASACSTPAAEGMRVATATAQIVALRRDVLSLILAEHPSDCFNCKKSGDCGLHRYCAEYGVVKAITGGEKRDSVPDISSPFLSLDRNKCILCGKCVRVCERLQCCDVLDFSRRGRGTRVGPAFDLLLSESGCVACGNCVAACPVGALMPRDRAYHGALYVDARVPTVCPYCGVGCEIELLVSRGRIVGTEAFPARPGGGGTSGRGLLCVKGRFAYGYVGHADRLTRPLLRREGRLVPASWDEALDLVARTMRDVADARGPSAVAGLSSARCTNEENYLFQKLFRAALGSNNVDHCARLCHSSTVAALAESLGSGAMTGSIEDVDAQDLIFVTGSNTTETHPVIGARIKRAARAGATLIVADPRRIELADEADLHLQIRSGTNEALFGGMARAILDEGLEDRAFLEARTEGFEAFARSLEGLSVEEAAAACGIDAGDLRAAARLYARSRAAGIYYAMGLTQFARGTAGVLALSSLALLCGKVGTPGSGIYPLRGQNNVQGACDMGCLPGDLPGYAKVADPAARGRFAAAWGTEPPAAPGLASTDMMEACARGEIGFLYVIGENPMLSDPDSARTERSLRAAGFLVVQDIFLTETAALADVVLPAACAAEKDGTFTNTERRVQRVRKAVSAPGEARDDASVLIQLMDRLGLPQEARDAPAVFSEIARLVPSYAGMSYGRLEAGGLQWPCPEPSHPGTPTLHLSSFPRKGGEGKALLAPAERGSPAEGTDEEFPFALVTGRILQQYHTRTMTGRVEGLTRIAGSALIAVNPEDAASLGLVDGGLARLASRRGEIVARARLTDRVRRGELFLPFHFAQAAANRLTASEPLDPKSRIPELKRCAVRVEPARDGEPS